MSSGNDKWYKMKTTYIMPRSHAREGVMIISGNTEELFIYSFIYLSN